MYDRLLGLVVVTARLKNLLDVFGPDVVDRHGADLGVGPLGYPTDSVLDGFELAHAHDLLGGGLERELHQLFFGDVARQFTASFKLAPQVRTPKLGQIPIRRVERVALLDLLAVFGPAELDPKFATSTGKDCPRLRPSAFICNYCHLV